LRWRDIPSEEAMYKGNSSLFYNPLISMYQRIYVTFHKLPIYEVEVWCVVDFKSNDTVYQGSKHCCHFPLDAAHGWRSCSVCYTTVVKDSGPLTSISHRAFFTAALAPEPPYSLTGTTRSRRTCVGCPSIAARITGELIVWATYEHIYGPLCWLYPRSYLSSDRITCVAARKPRGPVSSKQSGAVPLHLESKGTSKHGSQEHLVSPENRTW